MPFNAPFVPLVHGLKLFWDRVTFSRLTKIYFIFSFLHCSIQLIFQAQAFVANANAATFLQSLIIQGNATDPGFAVYETDLRMCETVPTTVLDVSSCPIVWDGHTHANGSVMDNAPNYAANVSSIATSSPSASPTSSVSSAADSSLSSVTTASTSSAPSATTALSSSSVFSSAPLISSTTVSTQLTQSSSSTNAVLASSPAPRKTVTVTVITAPTATAKVDDASDDDEESDGETDADDDEQAPVRLHQRREGVLPETQIRLMLDGNANVSLGGLNGQFETQLPRKCLYALNWPLDVVENTKREDFAFIAFQGWLLGMSLVALLNESIPHIVASLLTHILATAWGGLQIWNTEDFHHKFSTLTTQGACGVNLLPDYWKGRANAEIPSLALNIFALFVSAFLSWRLMKTFGWQTFKRVGASRTINRVYNLVLMFSIAIQLALFFVGASAALWIDQVINGNIGRLTMQPTAFKAVMITVLALLVPWLSLGWVSVRKEYRIQMMAFLAIAVAILAGWGSMFIAATFRWTYVTWLFFRLMTTAAVLLVVVVLILGIVCRVNFGKGLTRYLSAHEELGDDSQPPMKTYDSEKIAFPPSFSEDVPSFSVMFGSGLQVPPPSQMRFPGRNQGPRFTNSSASASWVSSNPFETPAEGRSVNSGWTRSNANSNSQPNSAASSPPFGPSSTPPGYGSPSELSRQTSRSSQASADSAHSAGSAGPGRGRRWVIE